MGSPYATFEGKTYLKTVLVAQANSAVASGEKIVPPVGTVLTSVIGEFQFEVVEHLKKPRGSFKMQRTNEDRSSAHGVAKMISRIIDVPDVCPPVANWERADV